MGHMILCAFEVGLSKYHATNEIKKWMRSIHPPIQTHFPGRFPTERSLSSSWGYLEGRWPPLGRSTSWTQPRRTCWRFQALRRFKINSFVLNWQKYLLKEEIWIARYRDTSLKRCYEENEGGWASFKDGPSAGIASWIERSLEPPNYNRTLVRQVSNKCAVRVWRFETKSKVV